MIVHRCACEKSKISIIITFITQASLKYLQELGTFLAPQNRAQGRCVTFSQEALVKGCRTLGQDFSIELLSQPKIQNIIKELSKI